MSDKISTLVNLISPKIGSYGVYANDEFFAPLERMLSENDPIFIPDKYEEQPDENDENWKTILNKKNIQGDAVNNFNAENESIFNWVKLKIFPDGGVARLRLWGDVFVDWDKISKKQILELSALNNGGKII